MMHLPLLLQKLASASMEFVRFLTRCLARRPSWMRRASWLPTFLARLLPLLLALPTAAWAPISESSPSPAFVAKPIVRTSYVNEELVRLQLSWREEEIKQVQPKYTRVWARVTACSPGDPQDVEYYRRNGYAGSTYNIAASYSQFPKGTKIRVPGYMDKSYPDKFWEVDSSGGSVIRRSARAGIRHIDVKFATHAGAKAWGSRWMYIDVIYP